jgi:hypothetical protein
MAAESASCETELGQSPAPRRVQVSSERQQAASRARKGLPQLLSSWRAAMVKASWSGRRQRCRLPGLRPRVGRQGSRHCGPIYRRRSRNPCSAPARVSHGEWRAERIAACSRIRSTAGPHAVRRRAVIAELPTNRQPSQLRAPKQRLAPRIVVHNRPLSAARLGRCCRRRAGCEDVACRQPSRRQRAYLGSLRRALHHTRVSAHHHARPCSRAGRSKGCAPPEVLDGGEGVDVAQRRAPGGGLLTARRVVEPQRPAVLREVLLVEVDPLLRRANRIPPPTRGMSTRAVNEAVEVEGGSMEPLEGSPGARACSGATTSAPPPRPPSRSWLLLGRTRTVRTIWSLLETGRR